MKINSTSANLAFGKTPLFQCRVTNTKTNQLERATLYQMDPDCTEDYREIHKIGDNRVSFYDYHMDFSNATVRKHYGHKFYLIKSDITDEPILGIETSLHYFSNMPNQNRDGVNTIIDEIAINKDYKDAELPLLAQVAVDSKKSKTANIITAFRKDECKLDKAKFSKTKYDAWLMPAKRYDTLLKIAAKKAYVRPVNNN